MSKPIVVQKYGGKSVSDLNRLMAVAERVVSKYRQGYGVVVVISAMGDTTERVLQLANQISPNPPRRELDMLLSAGERISMALLSMAIQKLGVEAISFTGSQSGIITNDRHFDAKIIEVRPIRIQDELERDKVVIVAGFQGMSYKREITTLGRGGSDLTAVALTAALEAEACEIYSDFDGIFDADPRIVSSAKKIPSISGEEMELLSRSGAKVLYSEAVAWARKHKIALYAKASHSNGTGTVVRTDLSPEQLPLPRPLLALRTDLKLFKAPLNEKKSIKKVRDFVYKSLSEMLLAWEDGENLSAVAPFDTTPSQLGEFSSVHALSVVGRAFAFSSELAERLRQAFSRASLPVRSVFMEPLRQVWIFPAAADPTSIQREAYRVLEELYPWERG